MDNAELYTKNNNVSRINTTLVLEKYNHKIKWNGSDRVLDIGCGDGSVTTTILKKFMPTTYKKLIGCDISEKMVNFANEHYSDKKTSFQVLDIGGKLPETLRGSFDHVFSFIVLHWVHDQELALSNIYQLLSEQGDCLLTLVPHHPALAAFRVLAKRPKWFPWTKNIQNLVAPYTDLTLSESVELLRQIMLKVEFKDVTVEGTNLTYYYDTMETYREAMKALIPYKIPPEFQEEFMNEYINVNRDMNLIQENEGDELKQGRVKIYYTRIDAFGRK